MSYTPLTNEQYQAAIRQGFNNQQIMAGEKVRMHLENTGTPFNPASQNSQFIQPTPKGATEMQYQPSDKTGVMQNFGLGSGIQQTAQSLAQPIISGAKNVGAISQGVGQDVKNIGTDNYTGGKFSQGFQFTGNLAKAALSPITQTIEQGTGQIADQASNLPGVQKFANSKIGTAIVNTAGVPQEKYNQWTTQHPEAAKNLEALGNIAALGTSIPTGEALGSMAKSGLDVTAEAAKPGLSAVKSDVLTGIDKGGNLIKKIDVASREATQKVMVSNIKGARADALETVRPKLTPLEEARAKAAGRGETKGVLKRTIIKPTKTEIEMGNVAHESGVSSKNTFDVNINKMKDFQKASANKIRIGFRELDQSQPLNFDKPQFKGQLGNVMNSIEKPITLVGDSTKIATKFKSAVMKLADSVKPTREGLLDLRQNLDRLIDEQLPSNIYSKDTPLGQYVRTTRRAINDFTESKIPDGKLADGSTFKGELRKQSLLYDAIDNVAERAPREGESGRPILGKTINFAKKHPLVTGAAIYGAEKAAKNLGVPLP